jgi:hypothetical protein
VAFVTAVLVAPVLELVAVTVAPLIMAPDASLTVPARAPVPAFCACTVDKQLSAKTNTISDEKQRLTSLLRSCTTSYRKHIPDKLELVIR